VSAAVAPLDLADDATLAELIALQRASYGVEADLVGAPSLPPMHETAEQLRACGETFLGLRRTGRLLGAVAYKRDGATVDIHRLVVHPAAFRRGVATALLDALEGRETGAGRWVVGTSAANAPALALYARRGFHVTEERTLPGGIRYLGLERPGVD
jgi:ribosomal protein S18 acetylase RimI-like enzyme